MGNLKQKRLVVEGFTETDANLERVIRDYLTKQNCDSIGFRRDEGNVLPVVIYRAPNGFGTKTFVLRPGENQDEALKRLAGNIGIKYSPKWRTASGLRSVI